MSRPQPIKLTMPAEVWNRLPPGPTALLYAQVGLLIMNECVNAGRDLGCKTRAVEHAIMAHLRLHVMHPHGIRDLAAEPVRRLGLAHPRDVVLLALNRHQGDAL